MVNGAKDASDERSNSRLNQNIENNSLSACLPTSSFTREFDWHTYRHSDLTDLLSRSVSSSTSSWSDELEGESTKKLGQQLECLENVLYNDFPAWQIYTSRLLDECRLWQQLPHLRVLGVKISTACQTMNATESIADEIIAKHGNYEEVEPMKASNQVLQVDFCEEQEMLKEKIKKTVIDQIFVRIWPDVVKKIGPFVKELSKNQNFCDKLMVEPNTPLINIVRCDGDRNVVNQFNKLSVDSSASRIPLRSKSGCNNPRTIVRQVFPVVDRPFTNQTIKYLSPEQYLSPLTISDNRITSVKSAGSKKKKSGYQNKVKPSCEAKVGKVVLREESRSILRQNLKTSPPVQWSHHITLPPIETNELLQKVVDSNARRSTSALMKLGQPLIHSRPNTSKIILDSDLLCSSRVEPQVNILRSNIISKSSDRRKWKSRGNVSRK